MFCQKHVQNKRVEKSMKGYFDFKKWEIDNIITRCTSSIRCLCYKGFVTGLCQMFLCGCKDKKI